MNAPAIVDDARLVDVQKAMTMLGGVGRSYLYELLARGEIEAVKVGRRRMVIVSSIDAFVDRLRQVAS